MIAVTQAIIYEWAVMVKSLDAFITDCAVKGRLRFDHFAIRAHIVEMQSDIKRILNQLLEVVDRLQVTRIKGHRKYKERDAYYEQAYAHPPQNLVHFI